MRSAGVLGLLVLLTSNLAFAGTDRVGVRGTLVGESLTTLWPMSDLEGGLMWLSQCATPPMLEALIPLGPGDLLLGGSYARHASDRESKDTTYTSSNSRSMWAMALSAGYAFNLIPQAEKLGAIRLGGRLAYLIGGFSDSYNESYGGDTYSDESDESIPGTQIMASIFLQGEYLFFANFGLQGELGLSLLYDDNANGNSDADESNSFLNSYTALSAVFRF